MDNNLVTRERDRLLHELGDFLSIPSVSTLPEHAADCRAAAHGWPPNLGRLGCARTSPCSRVGAIRVVWAESPPVEGKPTLLIYGHYDVQPPDPLEEWESPPFSPTVRDGNLFARGADDDKGQVYCLLKAYEAVRAPGGKPPLNVRFIFEGEEECGGHVISDLLREEPWRTEVDAALISDMAYYAPGIPAVYTALRGFCYAEIVVRTLDQDLHSGSFGGVAPNAIETARPHAQRAQGRERSDSDPEVVQGRQVAQQVGAQGVERLPFEKRQYLETEVGAKALTGLKEYSVLERTWALPTFEIHGIRGGFTGDGAKTIIPAQATAKVSLRLVPGKRLSGSSASLFVRSTGDHRNTPMSRFACSMAATRSRWTPAIRSSMCSMPRSRR
jgi:acetylornithine deacetylase/succinyl-diaminopimelate desuccinylase-like protein